MTTIKLTGLAIWSSICIGVFPNDLLAFHDGGVASCSMCHIMHRGSEGFEVPPTIENNFLLLSETPTDLCLSCHSSENGAVWSVNPLTPAPERGGGNFIFGTAPNLNDGPDGAMHPLAGSHGIHNCIALSNGVVQDPLNNVAPGGTYPSASLGCTSCHDPHGNDNFRMLWGAGHVQAGDFYFMYPAPQADGLPLNGAAESRANHTAYRSGWTNWCANCHGFFHENQAFGFAHPVRGTLGADVMTSYDRYNGTGDPTGGTPLNAYIPQVPFQSLSITTTSTNGPDKRSEIACITCHRAHGSSATDLGRWDFNVLNLRLDGSVSGSYPLPTPYSLGTLERQLCVKCHEQDTRTHGFDQACTACHRGELETSTPLPTGVARPAK